MYSITRYLDTNKFVREAGGAFAKLAAFGC